MVSEDTMDKGSFIHHLFMNGFIKNNAMRIISKTINAYTIYFIARN
jgi:hypothetical protein